MGVPKTKWTEEEEASLRQGVDRYGPGKWRLIQKDPELGPFLGQRSNVDLKDKWRNLHPEQVPANGDKKSAAKAKEYLVKFDDMVFEAITILKEKGGSSITSILKFCEDHYVGQVPSKKQAAAKLKHLVHAEKIIKVKQQYRINEQQQVALNVRKRKFEVTIATTPKPPTACAAVAGCARDHTPANAIFLASPRTKPKKHRNTRESTATMLPPSRKKTYYRLSERPSTGEPACVPALASNLQIVGTKREGAHDVPVFSINGCHMTAEEAAREAAKALLEAEAAAIQGVFFFFSNAGKSLQRI